MAKETPLTVEIDAAVERANSARSLSDVRKAIVDLALQLDANRHWFAISEPQHAVRALRSLSARMEALADDLQTATDEPLDIA